MTRAATGDLVTVAPTNNIYTALLGLASVAVLIGCIVIFLRAKTLGIPLFGV